MWSLTLVCGGRLSGWELTKLAAQVRDECGNPLVFKVRKVPRFHAYEGSKAQLMTPLFGTTILTTPIYYHQPDPVREMFDRLSVTSGFESDEVCHVRTLVACRVSKPRCF